MYEHYLVRKKLRKDGLDEPHRIISLNENVKVKVNPNRKPNVKHDYDKWLCGEPYKVWIGGGKLGKIAKEKYRYHLCIVCELLNMTTEQFFEYSDDFKEANKRKDVSELTRIMRDLIIRLTEPLEEADSRAATIHMHYNAFKSFCDYNNIQVNFSHLQKFLPKKRKKGKDIPYTKYQIYQMWLYADLRGRVIILIFSSTGMREDALCNLRVGDIKRIPENPNLELLAGEIKIYGEDDDEDTIYCTPECYNTLQTYLEKRRTYNEIITDNSPVILRRFPKNRVKPWTETRTVSRTTVSKILINVATDARVRKLSHKYRHTNRYVNKITVGFRKFAESTMIGARDENKRHKMSAYIADSLLSHKIRRETSSSVINYDYSEKLEDYLKVVPDLTINKEAEFKAKLQQAENKIEGLRGAENYIAKKEMEIIEMQRQMAIVFNFMKTHSPEEVKNLVSPTSPVLVTKNKIFRKDGKPQVVKVSVEDMAFLQPDKDGNIKIDKESIQ